MNPIDKPSQDAQASLLRLRAALSALPTGEWLLSPHRTSRARCQCWRLHARSPATTCARGWAAATLPTPARDRPAGPCVCAAWPSRREGWECEAHLSKAARDFMIPSEQSCKRGNQLTTCSNGIVTCPSCLDEIHPLSFPTARGCIFGVFVQIDSLNLYQIGRACQCRTIGNAWGELKRGGGVGG